MHYTETAAGGYTRLDGDIAFFGRVQALLSELGPDAVVVDFGAGRGRASEDPVPYRRNLHDLRATDRRVIGLDVDPVVLENPLVDEAHIIEPGVRLPIPDASVDLIVSDFTFEHVDDPGPVAREFERILKPGGWVCARTPNKWGFIAIGARLVPNRLHVRALHTLQPGKHEVDTFPTRYRMNTRGALRRIFPAPAFEVHAYTTDYEPHLYAGQSRVLTSALWALRALPAPLRSMWVVFVRKTAKPSLPAS